MINNDLLKKKILDKAFKGELSGHINISEPSDGYYSIPQNWKWYKLGDIVNIVNGFTPLRTEKSFWDKEEINWFTIEDIRLQGQYITKTKQYITNKALGNSNRLLPPKTTLLCCTASVGEVAITEIPLTTNQQFNGLILKSEFADIINPYYVFEYSKTLKNILIDKAGKTTINFVSTKKLSEVLIPIPPRSEQDIIVKKIEDFFELIDKKEKNDQEKQKLKDILKEKILDSAIHGELVDNNKLLSPFNCNEYCNELPFSIPKNWKWTKFGDLGEITSSKRVFQNEWTESGVPFYRARDIVSLNKGKGISDLYISEKMYNDYSTKYGVPKGGDILLTGVGTIGESYVVKNDDRFYFKDGNIIWYKNDIGINPEYLKLFFESKTFFKQIYETAKGATVLTLTISHAKDVLIPVPPLEEQKRIVEKIEQCFELIEQL